MNHCKSVGNAGTIIVSFHNKGTRNIPYFALYRDRKYNKQQKVSEGKRKIEFSWA